MNNSGEVGDMIDLLFMVFVAFMGLVFISSVLFFGVDARDQVAVSDVNEVSTIQDLIIEQRIGVESGLRADIDQLQIRIRYVKEYGELPSENNRK